LYSLKKNMPLKTVNPANEEVIQEFDELSDSELEGKISKADAAYQEWRERSFSERAVPFLKAAELLKKNSREYGELMTLEMGKPITQAIAEAEKCAWVCEYYAEKAEDVLAKEIIETDAGESYVQYDPLGIILAVMPWNFPFWQLFRAAAPIMMAGNTMVLKHASNVPQCAELIERIFVEAGFPDGAFQNLAIGSGKVSKVIDDPRVKGATLTGSEYAGSQVAMQCGKEIMPTLLELGGSDPFIVLADADLDKAANAAVGARFQNNGQSCIASKRFIVMEDVFEEFVGKFKSNLEEKKFGNPMEEDTVIGPLATESILNDIVKQVDKSVEMGAKVVSGGKRREGVGYFFEPTLLSEVGPGMPAYDEETFGPVAALIKVKNEDEAIKVANDTLLGLGGSIWTADIEKAKKLTHKIDSGAVFINGMVKSDPRLPFGGVKKSGYGRELAGEGIKHFTNIKTVWIGKTD
jgi:succinate-semialdehyde dehydrogenase / glutarate-semialdehyde dehydrogenase